MCKEDIREGRKKYTQAKFVQIAGPGDVLAINPSNNRTHITVAAGGNICDLTPTDIFQAGVAGWQTSNTQPPIDMDVETHGDIVTKGWRLQTASVANIDVLIIETFWTDPDK